MNNKTKETWHSNFYKEKVINEWHLCPKTLGYDQENKPKNRHRGTKMQVRCKENLFNEIAGENSSQIGKKNRWTIHNLK